MVDPTLPATYGDASSAEVDEVSASQRHSSTSSGPGRSQTTTLADSAALYEQFTPMLRRYVQGKVGSHDVEDIIHEVWVRALNAGQHVHARSPHAWLLVTARNLVIDGYRHGSRVTTEAISSELADGPHPTQPELPCPDLVEEAQEVAWVRTKIAQLPQSLRVTFAPSIDGISADAIQKHFSLGRATYYDRRAQALKLLKADPPVDRTRFWRAVAQLDPHQYWMLQPWIEGTPTHELCETRALDTWSFYRQLELAMQQLEAVYPRLNQGASHDPSI